MHYICRSFIGKHNDFSWSQYWENESDDLTISSKKGHIFGLISFTLKSGDSQIATLGKNIISSLNNHYYSRSENITLSLKSTINHLIDTYQDVLSQVNIVIAVSYQGQIYLCSSGQVSSFIFKDSVFSQILLSQSMTIKNVVGPITDLDRIFLTTNNFIDKISFEKIKTALSQEDLSATEEVFFSTIYSITNQTDLSACIIEIHQDINEKIEDHFELSDSIENDQIYIKKDQSSQIKPKNNLLNIINKFTNKKDVYVDSQPSRSHHFRKKINLFVALFVIISLSISIFIGYKKNKVVQSQKQFAAIKEEISQKVQSAIAIKNLNLDDAKKQALEAQGLLDKLVSLNVYSEEVNSIRSQIEAILTQTGETINTDTQKVFLDISTLKIDSPVNKIFTYDNQLLLVSQKNNLNKIDINTKKNISEIKLGVSGELTSLSSNNDQIYFIADNILYALKSNTPSLKIDFSKSDIDAIDFSFWNGILYVLSNKRIFKYTSVNDIYNNGSNWLSETSALKSDPKSISIDGNIWIVSQNGELQSFTRGVENTINITKNNLPLSAKKIIASPKLGNIYILDGSNNVYVYKSTGEVLSKYSYGDKTILDITISEKNSSLYILCDDQNIYSKSL